MQGSGASLAFESDGCVSEDELLCFVHGSVDDERRSAIRAHVDTCDDCRELLAIAGRDAAARGGVGEDDPPIRDTPVMLGETIDGRFLIEREIGRGGMGVVYAAKHLAMNRPVAVKVMGDGLAKDDDAVRRFLRESRVASKLESPHVARVFDVGRLRSGAPYMVMELLDGEDLERLVRRDGPFDIERAVTYVMQACDALAEAHALSVIHRDVKLENLFLVPAAPESIIKVLDFGLATGGQSDVAEASLTRSNSMMGTPRYMSPEQLHSARDVDARTDVWALGVCLYRLVTRRYPYDGPHFAALCVKIATAKPKRPSLSRPDLPPSVEHVILRCLSREPSKRYPGARELSAALARALAAPLANPDAPDDLPGEPSTVAGAAVSDVDPYTQFASTQMPVALAVKTDREAPHFLQHNGLVQIGEIIAGKYRVDRVLGVGGMGIVVAVTHLQLGELFALKFLHPDVASNPEIVARFMREAQAAARIKSELIVRVNDVGTLADGAPFMVMEHLVGDDLARRLATSGPMVVSEAVDYVLQACAGIAEAHALGIVHRDLKPSNLFLTKRLDGSTLLKVLDFGISTAASDASNPSLTNTREIFGSPAYMSPEQIRSTKSVDVRTDVWALGVILYELLTGALPFDGKTAAALLAAVAADTPKSARSSRPQVSEGLDLAVKRCLEKSPDARFQTVAELALAIEPFGSGECSSLVRRFTGSSPSLVARPPVGASPAPPTPAGTPFVEMARPAGTTTAEPRRTIAVAVIASLAGVGILLAGASLHARRGRSVSHDRAAPIASESAPSPSTQGPGPGTVAAAASAVAPSPSPSSSGSSTSSPPSTPSTSSTPLGAGPSPRPAQRPVGGASRPSTSAAPTAPRPSATSAGDPWSTSH